MKKRIYIDRFTKHSTQSMHVVLQEHPKRFFRPPTLVLIKNYLHLSHFTFVILLGRHLTRRVLRAKPLFSKPKDQKPLSLFERRQFPREETPPHPSPRPPLSLQHPRAKAT
ncbi:hypothetical protein CDAR_378721 [Caerostris darwini]|uniref:Uncharacterized protein n=1 Tax=Caerostris darwini TaxID=1538125 RepID=A0AAV4MTB5_9ARAC|nr:hypothetical protein CDAR_378721 [Caerostris darwini]